MNIGRIRLGLLAVLVFASVACGAGGGTTAPTVNVPLPVGTLTVDDLTAMGYAEVGTLTAENVIKKVRPTADPDLTAFHDASPLRVFQKDDQPEARVLVRQSTGHTVGSIVVLERGVTYVCLNPTANPRTFYGNPYQWFRGSEVSFEGNATMTGGKWHDPKLQVTCWLRTQ